jgi:hypothetical protein
MSHILPVLSARFPDFQCQDGDPAFLVSIGMDGDIIFAGVPPSQDIAWTQPPSRLVAI